MISPVIDFWDSHYFELWRWDIPNLIWVLKSLKTVFICTFGWEMMKRVQGLWDLEAYTASDCAVHVEKDGRIWKCTGSVHPQQNCVIRTLNEWADNVSTKDEVNKEEKRHIKTAIKTCIATHIRLSIKYNKEQKRQRKEGIMPKHHHLVCCWCFGKPQ